MAQQEEVYRRVIVKKDGEEVLVWTKPMIGELSVTLEAERTVIKKHTWFGTEKYMPSLDESVETSSSWFHW